MGSGHEVRRRHCSPPLQTLADREGGAEAMGSTTRRRPYHHAAVPACTACRCLVQSSINGTRGAYRGSRYVINSVYPLDLLLIDQAILSHASRQSSLPPPRPSSSRIQQLGREAPWHLVLWLGFKVEEHGVFGGQVWGTRVILETRCGFAASC
jgi:hypothetical protein